jgi:hypothetical protein
MPSPRRIWIVLALALSLAAVAALAAEAGRARSASAWTKISGPTGAGPQIGLARTGDGVLHVIWNRGNPAPTSIFDTRISPAGKTLGTTTVATRWGGANGLALLVMPDKTLRLFASGSPVAGSPVGGINTLTAQANGTGWTLDKGAVWGGPGAAATQFIGATLTRDGQPVTSWTGVIKQGIDTNYTTTAFEPDMGYSDLVTDAASGAIVLAGTTIFPKGGGTFVKQVLPGQGPSVLLPSAVQTQGDSGISARLGAPGVYVAYSNFTRDGVTKPTVRLYRYGGATRTIASGQFSMAKVFAGPSGRLWLAWGGSNDGIFVTRTSKAATTLEPVQKLTLPTGTSQVWNAQGEGSTGPLDLFPDLSVGSGRGFWHAQVLAQLSLTAHVGKRAKNAATAPITISLRDAGDPVPGAKVSVGGKRLTTDAKGDVTLALRPGSFSAGASASGYAPVTATFTVQ